MLFNNIKFKTCVINILSISFLTSFLQLSSESHGQTCNIYFEPYPIRNFQTGCGVADITAADFNVDGLIDIAVCSDYRSIVSVILNQTNTDDIFFSEPFIFSVGWEPQALVSGDFDLDGKQDIITVNQSTKDITILRNTSTKDSLSFDIIPGNNGLGFAQYMDAADFNGDGKLDLVIDGIYVFQNISTLGNIAFKLDYYFNHSCGYHESITTSDFDGDGKSDFAARHNPGYEFPHYYQVRLYIELIAI